MNKCKHEFTVVSAGESRETLDCVNRILKEKLDIEFAAKPLQTSSFQNELILSGQNFRKNEDEIIFQNYLGNYLTPSTVRETIHGYCKKAKVDYKGTHGFRHTHAVLLLESGASIKFVSNRLGHKTIKTTSDTYLDITEKIEEDELKKFASYTSRKTKSARNRHE